MIRTLNVSASTRRWSGAINMAPAQKEGIKIRRTGVGDANAYLHYRFDLWAERGDDARPRAT
jgi:hypothetical protein